MNFNRGLLFLLIGIIFIIIISVACSNIYYTKVSSISDYGTIENLNADSDFVFSVMSDNHGEGLENKYFKKMYDYIKKSDSKFIIGLGDHVKKHTSKDFLRLIQTDSLWHNHFYPTIADGENDFFGKGQWDWGAGAKLFDFINLDDIKGYRTIKFRENRAEYYAQLKINQHKIHLIQVHFPDEPIDTSISFKQDSRDFIIDTLKQIKKSKNDIIIVGAHSVTGFWHHLLTKQEQKILFNKADLIFSATSHIFDRAVDPLNGDKGSLIINTGSVTSPILFCPPGYLQVNVMKSSNSIILQYIDLSKDKYEFADRGFAFIKTDKLIKKIEF